MPSHTDEAIERVDSLPYARRDSGDLLLDLYLPTERSGSLPVVIYMHGGAWLLGERTEFARRPELLAAQGFAVASIDYRLSREATFPAPLEDARAAIAWLRENAADFGLASDRVGAWGASAGGHLAALLALVPDYSGEPSAAAAVPYFGTHDLTVAGSALRPEDGLAPPQFLLEVEVPANVPIPIVPTPEARLLGVENVAAAPGAAREGSPVHQVSRSGSPLLICHGDRDGVVAIDHSLRLHEAALAAGGRSAMLVVVGANHEDERFADPDLIGAVAGFFAEHLGDAA